MQRYNLVTDCPDLSEEKDCDLLSSGKLSLSCHTSCHSCHCDLLRIDDDYKNELFPRSPDNGALPIFVR